MKRILFIIDAQNDFCSPGGSLFCANAENAVNNICELLKTKKFDKVICTMDKHGSDYPETKEGKSITVKHCQHGTWGYLLNRNIYDALYEPEWVVYEKDSFMLDVSDMEQLLDEYSECKEMEIYVCGFATDICVINNALLLKNTFGKKHDIFLIENCCSGTSDEMHKHAVDIMCGNFIDIV